MHVITTNWACVACERKERKDPGVEVECVSFVSETIHGTITLLRCGAVAVRCRWMSERFEF